MTLLTNADYATDKNLAEGVVAMMADAGVKVTLNTLTGKDYDNARAAVGCLGLADPPQRLRSS